MLIVVVVIITFIRRRADNFLFRVLSAFIAAFGWRSCFSLLVSRMANLPLGETALLALLDAAVAAPLYPVLRSLFERLFWEDDLQLSFRDKLK
jgi:hypothetical protein